MKNRIKQNLNQDTETRILDFDGGNGASIPMLIELAREYREVIDVTIIDRNNAAPALACLQENGFIQIGSSLRKENLFFYVLRPQPNFLDQIEQQPAFDLCIAPNERLSAVPGIRLRENTVAALVNCSTKMILSLASNDMYLQDQSFARSSGNPRGEILRNGPHGLQTFGLFDHERINDLMQSAGIREPETFIEEPKGFFEWIVSGFKTKTHGIVSNGKASRLDGHLIKGNFAR